MLHTLLYFMALSALSTAPIWAKLNQMPVEVLGFYRLAIAAGLLGLWIIFKKSGKKLQFSCNTLWVIASGFFFFAHLWTYKYAAKNTTVANMMIIFSSNPIWSSIGAIAFFGEKISKRLVISYLLALTGIFVLVAHDLNFGEGSLLGDWSATLSAMLYAAYMLTGKKARLFFDNTSYAFFQYTICALFFGFCIIGSGASMFDYGAISWISALGLVLLPTFLGHFTFTYLVNYMNLSLMTCGKLIEPVIAAILAYFIFNEHISPYAWLSFLLTGSSVLILFASRLREVIQNFRR